MPGILELNSMKTQTTPQNIFVYGTLKKGHGNHEYYLKGAKFLGQGMIEGIMFHIGGYPAVSLVEKFSHIRGEIYQVSWEEVLRMDRLEGVPNHYHRIQTIVYPYNKCWMYIYPHPRATVQKRVIPSGEWLGEDTPWSPWLGWNKGIEVSTIETKEDKIIYLNSSGKDSGRWILRKNQADEQYVLIDTKDNSTLGNYSYLGEVLGLDGKVRHKLQLPRKTPTVARTVEDLVKDNVMDVAAKSTSIQGPPFTGGTVISPRSLLPHVPETKEESIPQAANVLGIEVGPA